MISPLELAREMFEVGKDDAAFVQQLRDAYKAAVMSGSLSGGAFDFVSNSSKNGGSISVNQQMSEFDRIRAMRYALQWIDAGIAPMRGRALGRF